jgi:hypothetical protein
MAMSLKLCPLLLPCAPPGCRFFINVYLTGWEKIQGSRSPNSCYPHFANLPERPIMRLALRLTAATL